MRWLFLGFVLFNLTACASLMPQPSGLHKVSECRNQIDTDTAMRIDVIEKLMEQDRLYAALAHLDDLNAYTPQAKYLRAEILRKSQRHEEAKTLYQSLLDTCLVGEGYHGLGLIAGREGDLGEAVSNLSQATKLLPLTARVRNDYGYALLLMGELELAKREFMTAIELDDDARLAESNMVILFFMEGNPKKARAYAQRVNLDSQTVDELENQAKELAKTRL